MSEAEHRELIADASRAADTITALRAQIDRERAATIEAAGRVAWPHPWQPDHLLASASYVLFCAANHIRALHTDATRAAMDAIRREGYEAGVREAAALCVSLRKEADRPEAEAVGCMDCASAILALAASIPRE